MDALEFAQLSPVSCPESRCSPPFRTPAAVASSALSYLFQQCVAHLFSWPLSWKPLAVPGLEDWEEICVGNIRMQESWELVIRWSLCYVCISPSLYCHTSLTTSSVLWGSVPGSVWPESASVSNLLSSVSCFLPLLQPPSLLPTVVTLFTHSYPWAFLSAVPAVWNAFCTANPPILSRTYLSHALFSEVPFYL